MWRVFAVVRNVNVAGEGIAVVLALLVGSALRLYDLDHQSLWADEGIQYAIASAGHLSELLQRVQHRTMHPPLSFIMTHFFLLIHDSDFFLRLPSVLCGGVSLPLIYLLV
jgi:4-amino-4-deoxy-L-arabinose transferase-like glycosyltransferase